jgi:hypothetical protein
MTGTDSELTTLGEANPTSEMGHERRVRRYEVLSAVTPSATEHAASENRRNVQIRTSALLRSR